MRMRTRTHTHTHTHTHTYIYIYIYIYIYNIAIFIDLSKAFDTIDHTIVISKLEHYGVENSELQWFISYMHNRQQYVEIENIKSTIETITTGVPRSMVNSWTAAFF